MKRERKYNEEKREKTTRLRTMRVTVCFKVRGYHSTHMHRTRDRFSIYVGKKRLMFNTKMVEPSFE